MEQRGPPNRLLPQTVLPIWDLDETIKEMERGKKLGHRGIVISSEPQHFGLPRMTNPIWDRMWAAAEEMEQVVNFHVGSGDHMQNMVMDPSISRHAQYASHGHIILPQ